MSSGLGCLCVQVLILSESHQRQSQLNPRPEENKQLAESSQVLGSRVVGLYIAEEPWSSWYLLVLPNLLTVVERFTSQRLHLLRDHDCASFSAGRSASFLAPGVGLSGGLALLCQLLPTEPLLFPVAGVIPVAKGGRCCGGVDECPVDSDFTLFLVSYRGTGLKISFPPSSQPSDVPSYRQIQDDAAASSWVS